MNASATSPLFEIRIEPRWADQDPMGHINHVQYFRYLEEARVKWILQDGVGATASGSGFGMIIANISLDFRREWHHPAALVASAHVKRIGNSSFTLRQQLHAAEGGLLVAEGDATLVWVNLESHRPAPLRGEIRALLERHLLP